MDPLRHRAWFAFGLLAVVSSWRHFFPSSPHLGPLAHLEASPARIVVVAPHSDDEVLAAGGLLQQMQTEGAEPRVILATSGDGFRMGANYLYKSRVTAIDMLQYGKHRLGESKAALAKLGLPEGRLTFLGFPDQGIQRLWQECWQVDRPCTSPTTQMNSVPYTEARSFGSPYAGRELLGQLMDLFREARPAVVVFPHPNEAHVDHWALSNFVQAALEDLRRTEPDWDPPDEWYYLVHRGDWPAPKGYSPHGKLLPPETLAGGMTHWHEWPLTPEQVERKDEALRAYRSQTGLMKRYLLSFVRANEIFGTIERVRLPSPLMPAPLPGSIRHDGPPWRHLAWVEAATDPRGDTMAREVERGADITAVWAATDSGTLYIAAPLAARPMLRVQLHFFAKGFRTGQGWGDTASVAVTPSGAFTVNTWPQASGSDAVDAEVQGTWVRIAIPLESLGWPESVMINAEARVEGVLVDRTAWRPVSLDGR